MLNLLGPDVDSVGSDSDSESDRDSPPGRGRIEFSEDPAGSRRRSRCSDRCKLFEVGFLRGFLGFLAGERAHGGFPRRIPLDSYGGFSLSAGIPTEERARAAASMLA